MTTAIVAGAGGVFVLRGRLACSPPGVFADRTRLLVRRVLLLLPPPILLRRRLRPTFRRRLLIRCAPLLAMLKRRQRALAALPVFVVGVVREDIVCGMLAAREVVLVRSLDHPPAVGWLRDDTAVVVDVVPDAVFGNVAVAVPTRAVEKVGNEVVEDGEEEEEEETREALRGRRVEELWREDRRSEEPLRP